MDTLQVARSNAHPIRTRTRRLIGVVALACAALACAGAASAASQQPAPTKPTASATPFTGDAMWIWYVSKAEGGDVAQIAARAKKRGVETVYIKSGDGTDTWSQFTPQLVSALKRRGLNVCGWQFVYGSNPTGEARVGAAAEEAGADCLVIDAETDYEGRYSQASQYMFRLRQAVGDAYPLALASFPYVHYHPAFPYSVFLGPDGAEFNLPQVYWKAIGTSVDTAMTTTYTDNRVYERPISPVGQLYDKPKGHDVKRFRQDARACGFLGVSWWSWQHASDRGFRSATRRRIGRPRGYRPSRAYPTLDSGSSGDLVVWAQENLTGGGWYAGEISGTFGVQTARAVKALQTSVGLEPTGVLDAASWKALLKNADPVSVKWGGGRGKTAMPNAPRSARRPAVRDELGGRP